MTREFPWLSKCVKSFTVTDIGEIYELKNQIKTIDIKTPEVNHEGGKIKHKKNIDITR